MITRRVCHQINLQRHFGGGEVYTRFLSQALLSLGWRVRLFVHRRAGFWADLDMTGVEFVPVSDTNAILDHLPRERGLVVAHAPLDEALARRLRRHHVYCCFAHMPLLGRRAEPFRHCHTVFGVSRYVLDTLAAHDVPACCPFPLYGIADLERIRHPGDSVIRRASSYDWDERKLRDRLLGHLSPLLRPLVPRTRFSRQPGLTLGIVSRLTPIKQFPLLFEHLAPVIRGFPQVNIEIFGSGGYASVRDLKRSLAPIRRQVRFWGHQGAVAHVYSQLDFVLSGLPEKEALGLNLIEAQMCGCPVIAVRAAPFTETVIDGETGYLYTDPRSDGGKDFSRLLRDLTARTDFPCPQAVTTHLARFSREAFTERLDRALEFAMEGRG